MLWTLERHWDLEISRLTVLARCQREYRGCSLTCFMETWLILVIPDASVSIGGYWIVWANKDCTEIGNRKGAGFAILVNNCYCNLDHLSVQE